LPLYFIDLESQDNNKSVYDLQSLCTMKIAVERPCAQKLLLPQPRVLYVTENTRELERMCYIQTFTASTGKPFAETTQPPLRFLPLQSTSTMPVNSPYLVRRTPSQQLSHNFFLFLLHILTLLHTTSSRSFSTQLSIFLNQFKTMFDQLLQQNGLILNMLNTVIQKLTTQCPTPCE